VEKTRLSTKGQVVLPQSIRESRAWVAGTEFAVEEIADGIVLRPLKPFAKTRHEDVAGCLKYAGKAKTIREMDAAVAAGMKRRYGRS
jgi:AbrB family looped-hinge helix DNA binding protein